MDKTASFLGGIIAGAIGLGVASWFFAEYLPNKNEEKEKLTTLDPSETTESDVDIPKRIMLNKENSHS